jgi:hypothetical protein
MQTNEVIQTFRLIEETYPGTFEATKFKPAELPPMVAEEARRRMEKLPLVFEQARAIIINRKLAGEKQDFAALYKVFRRVAYADNTDPAKPQLAADPRNGYRDPVQRAMAWIGSDLIHARKSIDTAEYAERYWLGQRGVIYTRMRDAMREANVADKHGCLRWAVDQIWRDCGPNIPCPLLPWIDRMGKQPKGSRIPVKVEEAADGV